MRQSIKRKNPRKYLNIFLLVLYVCMHWVRIYELIYPFIYVRWWIGDSNLEIMHGAILYVAYIHC
jgi:hypothetical protein